MVAGIVPVNKGLELAKGEWIAHLDDDDEFSEDHLQVLLEHALENHYELVYGIIEMEITPGKWAHVGSYPPKLAHICRLSALYDSKLRFFKYDIKAWKYEEPGDWNLWRRMKEAGVKIGFVDRVVGRHYLEGRARALLAHKSPRKFGSLLRIPLQLQRRIARYPKFMNVEDYEKWYYSRPEARRYSGDERIWVNLSDMIQYFRPKRVFEFGSGLGNILQECGKRGIDAVGSETSRYAIQNNLCKEKLVKIGEIPKSRLPFRDCSFDLVFSSEVMEHVKEEHTEAIINELNRICSGYALLTINTFDYKQPGHQNMHSRNWWLARFEKCGFERDDKAWSDIDKTKYLQWDIYIFRKINARAR
jgi:SAM-dependent methyltransferase